MKETQINNIPNIPPEVARWLKRWKLIAVILVALLLLFQMFFTVGTEERGVILRLGKYQTEASPGLNWKIPFIDEVYLVPVERQLKQEFGFRTVSAGIQTRYDSRTYEHESLMLTGDLNMANVEWVVQYRIENAYEFLFKVRRPEQTLRDISESAMRQIIGDRTVNEILTVGRAEIENKVKLLMQRLCNEYETGIRIDQVVLQDITPPDPVKPSFNGVNEAQQQRATLINQAKAEYNQIIPRARGEALETIQKAEGYALGRVNTAKGETARFNSLYEEYIKAKDVTRTRIFLEEMQAILPQIEHKVIIDPTQTQVLPLLQLSPTKIRLSQNNDNNN